MGTPRALMTDAQKDKYRIYALEYYHAHPELKEAARLRTQIRRSKETSEVRAKRYEAQKKDYFKNRSNRLEGMRRWRTAHATERAEKARVTRKNNPGMATADYRARNMRISKAMPTWANRKEIQMKYIVAARATRDSGIKHVVDHFYPLKHKLLSGLHVPWNLRVIIEAANIAKYNNVTPNMLRTVFA